MRSIYLLRHAAPQMPGGIHRCLGRRSDPPLSPEGAAAAAALGTFFRERSVTAVGVSPLLRCRQTAELIFPSLPLTVLPGITELDCGAWDGMSFAEIRQRYPALYARRGQDNSVPPPGGETADCAAARGLAALEEFLSRTEGDVAVVAHAGINRAILSALLSRPYAEMLGIPMDYLSIYRLRRDGAACTAEAVLPAANPKEERYETDF